MTKFILFIAAALACVGTARGRERSLSFRRILGRRLVMEAATPADRGSEASPATGAQTVLVQSGAVLAGNGSEGIVQTANSLPLATTAANVQLAGR